MSKFTVYYDLISNYSVEVDAADKAAARAMVGNMTPSELDELDPVYEGWDLTVTACDDESDIAAGYSDFEEEEGEE